jgi:hypothetical protein
MEKCPTAFSRLSIFIVQYDFARNLAMALLMALPFFLWTGHFQDEPVFAALGLLNALLFFVMLLRYLKFFRHYSDLVFRSFLTYTTPAMRKEQQPSVPRV